MAFIVVFVPILVVMLPSVWAFLAAGVVGAAAGAGAFGLLTGREHNAQRKAAHTSTEQCRLKAKLGEINTTIRSQSDLLPPSTQGQLRMTVVGLEEIVDRWSSLDRVAHHQEAVRNTIDRHLPRTIELFLDLPDSQKPVYAQEFKDQIGLLAEAVAKTRDTIVAKNLNALRTNRWLLEESLTDPDEQLFREHGL